MAKLTLILLLYLLHYYDGCQYVKGTKQILIAVCVVEFTGSHSNFLVCKLQFYTVNVFTVFLYFYKIILVTTAAKIFYKSFLQCGIITVHCKIELVGLT